MSSQFFRQYIDLLNEQETPEWQKRARDIAMQMGVIAPNLANIEYKDNVPVKINGDPVPDRLYSPAERAKVKGQGSAASTGSKPGIGTQVQTDDDGNHMITTPDGKTIVVGPDGKPLPNGGKVTPGAASPSANDDRITALQKELKAKGADLGGFGPAGDGIDGKLGPKTRTAASKFPDIAAKYKDVLGDSPAPSAGSTTPSSGSTQAGQAASPAANKANVEKLNSALNGIEQLLQKYKVNVKEDVEYVLENINKFSQQEQLEIWRLITEEDKPKLPPGAKFDRSTGNWYVTEPGGGKRILGGTATTDPAKSFSTKKPGKFAKFISKLGGGKGIAKKAATRAGASVFSGPIAPFIAAGSIIWTGWDIGKALYDTFADNDALAELDDKDQAIIKQHMATIVSLQKNKEFMDQLDPATKKRLENALKGLNALAVDTGYKPDNQSASPAVDQKTADRVRDASGSVPGSQTTSASQSNQHVSGTLRMGKPDGPIQYNGKTVNPGDPEYAAASQALIQARDRANSQRSRL